jgi:hypothetical protein
MTVTFPAQVKQLQSRVLATGDKGGRMVLEFNIYDDTLIGELAKFVTADEEVKVTVEK